ncbi:hypothetical protein P0F65_10785 [Sphingomonas sp. I4]
MAVERQVLELEGVRPPPASTTSIDTGSRSPPVRQQRTSITSID